MSNFINCHCHTDFSNIRLLDSTNSIENLLTTASKMNYSGIAITDHEAVSSHVRAIQQTRKLKEKNIIPKDFKLILGNEIYLVDDLEEVRDNYQPGKTRFPHFLLLAKDKIGHEQLRVLSSRAWSRSFYTGMMERTPTLKSDLEEIVKPNKGHLIASSACLGSEVNIRLLEIKQYEEQGNTQEANTSRQKLHEFILWCIDVFGKDHFFIELQPALSDEQIYCNNKLIDIAEFYELKRIITTDAHYPRPEDRVIHEAFLNAKEGEREVASFYEACFLQNTQEIYNRMKYIDKNIIEDAIDNTVLIGDMVEDYTIEHETVIPRIALPEFELRHIFMPAYNKYQYIKYMAYSKDEQDRYLLKLIEDGFEKYIDRQNLTTKKFHEILNRINIELGELWEISVAINKNTGVNQSMSAYYVSVAKIVDIIWDDECGGNSLVGSGRGSAAGFLINYLIGVTQVNPLEYGIEMPHWRHLHRSRPDIGALDIDLDSEGSKRSQIIQALKNHFGEDKVMQVATFGTETSKAALNTAARGLGYSQEISQYLGSLIPFERGKNWSIRDCLYGNEEKGRRPVQEFINEIEKYPRLKETALGLNGLISRRGIHAGGVILFNEPYYKSNAMMKAPNGLPVTAYDLDSCQAVGNIKYDILTIECLDKIRITLDLLIENREIEKQETLRDTFDKYLHPEVIDKESEGIYKLLGSGEVIDLFQFSTQIGQDSIMKVKPTTLIETAAVNSLMRLMSDSGEQPIDTFIKYKNNISLWYEEMEGYGLNNEEVKIMEQYLLPLNGVSDTQENVMLLSMDENIAGFSVQEANKLRKVIAKSNKDEVENLKELFFKKGKRLGNREQILNYVWNVQISRQLMYSFSVLHTISYTLSAFQELNLNYYYNPIYWQTACLTVNGGGIESEETRTSNTQDTKYGKIAAAIGDMQERGVKIVPPDINKADFGFTPDTKNNSILFGLKGLVGVGDEAVHAIIDNRPYSSFKDFLAKTYETKLLQNTHILQLIKAGSFETFGTRFEIMKQYLGYTFKPRKNLTLGSLNTIIKLGIVPEEFALYVRFYNFRNYIYKKPYGKIPNRKTKNRLFLLNDISTEFLYEHFSDECIYDYENGQVVVAEFLFDKEYDKKMLPIKEWLSTQSTLELVNNKLFEEEWNKSAGGDISEWEMSSLSYYYTRHELEHLNKEKYSVDDFKTLPKEPVPTKEYIYRGQKRYEYQLYRIAGTVLDKDTSRHTVTILTTSGVVTVKLFRSNFSYFDKQISTVKSDGKKTVLEKSWFTRGEKLLLTGFRRGNQFVPRIYKNTVYQYAIQKIDSINDNGDLIITSERVRV